MAGVAGSCSRLLPLVVTAASLIFVPAAGPAQFSHESWFDANHGWRANSSAVHSTEDGGATWHRIFLRPVAIERIARTSRRAGIVGGYRRRFWTADNGAHWHATKTISPMFEGRGNQVFFVAGRVREELFQVVPWPPRGVVRKRLTKKLTVGGFAGIQPIPGGIAAAIDIGYRPPYLPKILIRRSGANRMIQLPASGLGTCNVVGISVNWPAMTVVGQPRESGGDCGSSFLGAIIWWTEDGGETWWSSAGDP
jgi:hypothetical protein